MNFCVWQISRKRFRSVWPEDYVIGTPYRQKRNLRCPEVFVQNGVQLHIARVVTSQLKLYLGSAWSLDQCIVMMPIVRAHETWVRNAVCVLPHDGVQCEGGSKSNLIGWVGCGSEAPDRFPVAVDKALDVCVSILSDHRGDGLRIPDRQS